MIEVRTSNFSRTCGAKSSIRLADVDHGEQNTKSSPVRARTARLSRRMPTVHAATGPQAAMVTGRSVSSTAPARAKTRPRGARRAPQKAAAKRLSAPPVAQACSIASPSIRERPRYEPSGYRLPDLQLAGVFFDAAIDASEEICGRKHSCCCGRRGVRPKNKN
jgi:hypothetical protein